MGILDKMTGEDKIERGEVSFWQVYWVFVCFSRATFESCNIFFCFFLFSQFRCL